MPSPSGCGGTNWVTVQQSMLAKGDYAAALAMFDSENTTNDMLFKEYGVARWHGTENLTGRASSAIPQPASTSSWCISGVSATA